MCLLVEKDVTNKFLRNPIGPKKITMVKYLRVRELTDEYGLPTGEYDIVTPYLNFPVEGGWLKPRRKNSKLKEKLPRCINGGCIHAYLEEVKFSKEYGHRYAVKCWAYKHDIIAIGKKKDVAVEKLWIPIEELDRIIKAHKRRIRDQKRKDKKNVSCS